LGIRDDECGDDQLCGLGKRDSDGDVADHGGAEWGDESRGHADGDGGDFGVDRGDAGESVDREGIDGAIHRNRDVHGQQHAEPDGKRDMEFWNDDGGDDHEHRFGDRSGDGDVADHSGLQWGDESGGYADSDGGDAGVDCGDAAEPVDTEGRQLPLHGHRNVLG